MNTKTEVYTNNSNKLRTRVCNTLNNGDTCLHGDNCRYAHHIDQLSILHCIHGDSCTFINVTRNGVYTNTSNRKCYRKHPSETDSNYCRRVGISKAIFTTSHPINRKFVSKNSEEVNKDIEDLPYDIIQPTTPPSSPVLSEYNEQLVSDETVLKVPEELAMVAMEIALKTGKTNIRIVLV